MSAPGEPAIAYQVVPHGGTGPIRRTSTRLIRSSVTRSAVSI
jgi:hypothetical protein